MNTFLPFADFEQSAKSLDNKRLGKQRIECIQILDCIRLVGSPKWINHPAVKMWEDHPSVLIDYSLIICLEWKNRGFKDTCFNRIVLISESIPEQDTVPWWLGFEPLHQSHRSKLISKDPKHYLKLGWTDPSDLEYFWPGKERGIRHYPKGK